MDDSTTLPEETAVDPSPRRFRLGTFSSLRHLNFRYLWLGTLCMSGGQWIQQVTLGWLLYDLTGSSVLLGLLNGLRAVPFLVASPIAGVAADRMDRKKLILRDSICAYHDDCCHGPARRFGISRGVAPIRVHTDDRCGLGVCGPGSSNLGPRPRTQRRSHECGGSQLRRF